jgi:hypothetical protein
MTKEDILRIINDDPEVVEARSKNAKRKARRASLDTTVSLLREYVDSKVSGLVVIGCTPLGGAKYSLTDVQNTDILLLVGMIKKVEIDLLERLKIDKGQ